MSALTEKLAGEHRFQWGDGFDLSVPACTCQPGVRVDDYEGHLIEVTEQAVRAQIAADIQAHCDQIAHQPYTLKVTPFMNGLLLGARIAKGGAS